MVELGQVFPIALAMAGLAAECAPVSSFLGHLVFELSMMRVLVARGARHVSKVVGDRRLIVLPFGCVTFHARDGDMRAHQRELRLLMPGQCKRGRRPFFYGVAALAFVGERRIGKL